MKIAIDLNDVIRDYSRNFVKYFKKGINNSIDEENINFYTNDMEVLLPFNNHEHYRRFVYEDFPFELYSKCPLVDNNLGRDLNEWVEFDLLDEDIEVMIVSPMESDLTIQSTYSFLAKIGSRIREVYFPIDSSTIWDKCDILITANPRFFNNKKDNKKIIKISKEYNKEYTGDLTYETLRDVIKDNNFINKIKNKQNDRD
jgi:hypothetical protein